MNDDDPQTCRPPVAHVFHHDKWTCDCGAVSYDALIEVITGRPVGEWMRRDPLDIYGYLLTGTP